MNNQNHSHFSALICLFTLSLTLWSCSREGTLYDKIKYKSLWSSCCGRLDREQRQEKKNIKKVLKWLDQYDLSCSSDGSLTHTVSDLVPQLGQHNTWINHPNQDQKTALLLAIEHNLPEVVSNLIHAGADIEQVDGIGFTPYNEGYYASQ